MKRTFLIMALACLTLWTKAQSHPEPVLTAQTDTVYSVVLKEKRPVYIYVPGHDTTYFSKPAYPVLYVLDGNGYFSSLITMVQQLSAVNGNTILPEMIIVAIPNTPGHRTRDLTTINSAMDKTSGGGENFISFMEKELIPYIDKNYPTAPYRTLIGHSLGGLMAVNILLKHTALFNNYIAIDPSMFYADDDLLKQVGPLLKKKDLKGRSLFLGMANTMNQGMDTIQVRADTTRITHHLRSILKLKDELQQNSPAHLNWDYRYYADDDHSSVPMVATYDGLRFVFKSNRFPAVKPQDQYWDTGINEAVLRTLIDAHYKQISAERGYAVKPPESLMNQLGYSFLQQKNFKRAQMFFQVNMDYYPSNFNVYDSMGDYLLAINKKAEAIDCFKKALALRYRADIKEKVDRLENK